MLGLNEAHAKYSCVWCKISSDDRSVATLVASYIYTYVEIKFYRWDMSIPFATWTQDEKRTIKEIEETVKSGTKLNYGCIKMPLISLELDHVIPDELHMLLRITDVLIQNLINAATSNDRNRSSIAQSKVYVAYTYGDIVYIKYICYRY